MSKPGPDQLLQLLNVAVDAFAVCEVGEGCGLSFPAWNKIVVHFVLKGEGSVECEAGIFPLRQGMIAIVPKNLAKQLNGRGRVGKVLDAGEVCPLGPGFVTVRTYPSEGEGLTVACAVVSATIGEGLGLFDHLWQPLVEQPPGHTLPHVFNAMLQELAEPGSGTKAIVEVLMKQCLILLLREHLRRTKMASIAYLPLMSPRLAPALQAMLAHPQAPHAVDSLAKLCGMSRSRFTHHFGRTYGTAPIEFLQAIRLQAGARLLRSSSLPVKTVAGEVGFASRSHFSRAFHRMFGVDPSSYRGAVADGGEAEHTKPSEKLFETTVSPESRGGFRLYH